MKEYFKFFSIPFIIVAVMAVVTIGMGVLKEESDLETMAPSGNTQRLTDERVFDNGEVLTDSEEEALREQIAEAELKTQSDIIIITLNETLENYVKAYEEIIGSVPTNQWVMVYADNFYDEGLFGYNKAHGDGVVFLDNWFREKDGGVHSWMSTSGKVEDAYSSSMIDEILNKSLENVDSDPYEAYSMFINLYVQDMTGKSPSAVATAFKPIFILIGSAIIAVIFFVFNWQGRKGKKTVNNRTYLVGGHPDLTKREDVFINKTVTKTKIESSSSSGGGGGGHHTSSGGFSHGGGGHSR